MGFGIFNLNQGDADQKGESLFNDLPRLILYVVMLLSAIFGVYYYNYSNKPLNVIRSSLEKSHEKQFRARMESTTMIGDSVISDFKSHQRYIPGRGLVTPNGSPLSVDGMKQDSLNSFSIFSHIISISELKKQDMYGNPTRHYMGSYRLSDDGDSTVHVFEYWINMRYHLPVRLITTTVERNVDVDREDESISRVTYTNIGYYDWE